MVRHVSFTTVVEGYKKETSKKAFYSLDSCYSMTYIYQNKKDSIAIY